MKNSWKHIYWNLIDLIKGIWVRYSSLALALDTAHADGPCMVHWTSREISGYLECKNF